MLQSKKIKNAICHQGEVSSWTDFNQARCRKRCEIQLAERCEEPLKDKRIYTNLAQMMALAHLKPKGYENLNSLPYNLFCPSVQKKISEVGGERYQCCYDQCQRIFTTLVLANQHLRTTGHLKLVAVNPSDESISEESVLEIQNSPYCDHQ